MSQGPVQSPGVVPLAQPKLDAGHSGTAGQTLRWSIMTILANILSGADSLLKILTHRERFL